MFTAHTGAPWRDTGRTRMNGDSSTRQASACTPPPATRTTRTIGGTAMLDQSWNEAPLCALDFEGTGAQDRENEAILEVAAVPIVDGSPDLSSAYESLINPGRPVPRRPWIRPGLIDDVLHDAPSPAQVGPEWKPASTVGT